MLGNGGYEPGCHPLGGDDIAWSGGAMIYHGWPCHLAGSADLPNGDGVEERLITTIEAMATKQRQA